MKQQIPLLFSTIMVRSLLADLKDVTRRTRGLDLVNENPNQWKFEQLLYNEKAGLQAFFSTAGRDGWFGIKCPYGKPGDLLWVKENWAARDASSQNRVKLEYQASPGEYRYLQAKSSMPILFKPLGTKAKWKPSIHMFKEVSRIWLEVVDISIERLNDITDKQARSEGLSSITKDGGITWKYGIPDFDGLPGNIDIGWPWSEWETTARAAFMKLWAKINGQSSVDLNPWLWVVKFKVLTKSGDMNSSLAVAGERGQELIVRPDGIAVPTPERNLLGLPAGASIIPATEA